MKCIRDLPETELRGKYVLVRAGFDVPLTETGEVADLFRVHRSAETIVYLSKIGARVIILSHIGRDPEETNAPVARALKSEVALTYVKDLTGQVAHDAKHAMRDGDVLMLENLRRDPRETKNDDGFARELAGLGDIYVNDAFSAAHRAHTSIVGIPKYLPHYSGLLIDAEVRELSKARAPLHPSFAILGGAKFETKAPLIRTLLATYDHVFIAGALANDVFKAKGMPVGRSLISSELPGADVLNHPNFLSPVDVTVERLDKQARVKKPEDVETGDKIMDIGPESLALIAPYIAEAKFILWNGPTGLYEAGYGEWTHAIAETIAKSEAQKVIGGGDTIAVIEESGMRRENLGFLSTGGGAMLEYILEGNLPGLQALE
jgi:phosphoglycerate kinase